MHGFTTASSCDPDAHDWDMQQEFWGGWCLGRMKEGPHGVRPAAVTAAPGVMGATCTTQNHMLEAEAKRAGAPTWATVRYMVAAIQYGGRITDELDKLLMGTYAEKYFHQVGGLQECARRLCTPCAPGCGLPQVSMSTCSVRHGELPWGGRGAR